MSSVPNAPPLEESQKVIHFSTTLQLNVGRGRLASLAGSPSSSNLRKPVREGTWGGEDPTLWTKN